MFVNYTDVLLCLKKMFLLDWLQVTPASANQLIWSSLCLNHKALSIPTMLMGEPLDTSHQTLHSIFGSVHGIFHTWGTWRQGNTNMNWQSKWNAVNNEQNTKHRFLCYNETSILSIDSIYMQQQERKNLLLASMANFVSRSPVLSPLMEANSTRRGIVWLKK